VDIAYLTVMKQLGDGAIHPNDGDISKQAELDKGLISLVKDTFQTLLRGLRSRA
jgi:hypothetical protein